MLGSDVHTTGGVRFVAEKSLKYAAVSGAVRTKLEPPSVAINPGGCARTTVPVSSKSKPRSLLVSADW